MKATPARREPRELPVVSADDIATVDNPRLLAEVALEHVEAHPEEWKQDDWRCGTALCFAGHVAISAGGLKWLEQDSLHSAFVEIPAGKIHVGDLAARLLGVPRYGESDSAYLFKAENTLPELRRMVANLPTRHKGGAQ